MGKLMSAPAMKVIRRTTLGSALGLIFLFACSNPANSNKNSAYNDQLMDVHGAGAQRSDPKSGNPDDYAGGHGPQGDVVYIYNYVRCVRGTSLESTASDYIVVDTGQDHCYDDGSIGLLTPCPEPGDPYYGQDAQYTGALPHYMDNGDGTVTDLVTGLMWEQGFHQVAWDQAAADAADATTGGYNDWRVPTIKELYSLINYNGTTGSADPSSPSAPPDAIPYIGTDYFDFEYSPTGRYIDSQYITSTAYVSTVMNNQEAFFGVNFVDGRVKGYPKTGNPNRSTYYARYVRGNSHYGVNQFQDNGDGTITDKATGLMWMKVDSGDPSVKNDLNGMNHSDGSLNWKKF
jgi:hypothetical protein